MLNDSQNARVWEHMIEAEVRALYFGDLAASYTRYKQWITGISFFASSAAFAAVIANFHWVPAVLALVAAAANAYAIAVNLDKRITTMAQLHSDWARIATDYDRLSNNAGADDAEDQLATLMERERGPSELATTEAPNNQKLLGEWEQRVLAMYHVADHA